MTKRIYLLFFVSILVYACGGSDSGETDDSGEENGDGFNRQVMLVHIADNIIIPAYEDFETKLESLTTATSTFTEITTEENLVSLREAWLEAYKVWQYIDMFSIGKAEELAIANYMNIYPVTVLDIENNIANQGYDFDSPANYDTQSFPALDYLLYGVKSLDDNDDVVGGDKAVSNEEALEKFVTDLNATNYKKYLTDVVARMSIITNEIVTDWNGSFRDEFVNSFDNTASSSLNKLVNDFVAYYESNLRAKKIGFPSGALGFKSSDKVEAYFNQNVSIELALEGLSAVEDFFNGKSYSNDTEELGLKAYLTFLEREDLVTAITDQLDVARNSIADLDTNLADQILTDNDKVLNTYDELQKVVAYFKTDMLQAFNISVDFQDSDGD